MEGNYAGSQDLFSGFGGRARLGLVWFSLRVDGGGVVDGGWVVS